MIRMNWLTVVAVVLALVFGEAVRAAAQSGGEVKAGVAAVDITPTGAENVLDRLFAKAMVFAQGEQKAAVVVCDLIGVPTGATAEARKLAADKTGIPEMNIIIAATHTHSGRQATDVANRIAQAIIEAAAAAKPARLEAGVARQDEPISFNRRFLMKDGTVRFNPGFLNPDVVRPVGPIDPEVPVLLARAVDGRPLGGVVNFALHACTVLKPGISADYPHFLERTLRRQLGDQFVCIYAAGACGDVNHFDINRIRPDGVQVNRGQTMLSDYVPKPSNERSPLTYQYIGESLGKTVASEVPKLNAVAKPSLAVRREMLRAPLATFSEMDLEWAKNVDRRKVSFLQGVRIGRILSLAELRKSGDTAPVEVQAIRFGDDTALVAMPGEMFVELGLAIKKASPFRNTLVVELSGSGHINYVPTRKAFVEGDYEVVNSRLESGGGELMADAAIRLLKDLKSDLR